VDQTATIDPHGVRIGVVLAGGEARRMGHDKRRLSLGGATLLERNLAFLQSIFPVVALSVRDAAQAPAHLPDGVEVVPDIVTGSPLAGIASVLTRYGEPFFALATDVVFPQAAAVERVLGASAGVDVATPVVGDHWEPLHAVYGPGCLPHIEALLGAGAHSILDLFPLVRVRRVPFDDPRPFFNVNTPGDWAEARRLAGEPPDEAAGPGAPGSGPLVLGVVGRSGSGKTTLIERLIPEFTARGLSVAAVKRVARFDIDTPGKDSWRHSQAGAQAYAVASASQLAVVAQLDKEPSLAAIVARYFPSYDVVVCEGYRHETPWVVEVYRPGEGRDAPLLDASVTLALVSDAAVPHPHRFAPADVPQLAAFLGARLGLPGVGS
jgi:molybdopterin-guanine dinucleotide biosynthesis protein MobB